MSLALRRLAARLIPALGYARCSHCHLPWSVCEPHPLRYQNYRSLFFVCTWCWPRTSSSLRHAYLGNLLWGTWARSTPPDELHEIMRTLRPQLRDGATAEVA